MYIIFQISFSVMLDFMEKDVIFHAQTVCHVNRYLQYAMKDIMEILVINSVLLAVNLHHAT